MKKLLVVLAVIAALAVGGYFFSSAKGDVCKNVIPEDAKAVMTFSGTELVKQLDFSFSDIFELLKLGGDAKKEDVGIDYLSPMYGFVSSDNYLCGVFALSDAKTFETAITRQNHEVESQRGFKWVYENDILACFDSDRVLLLGPISKAESDGVRTKVVEWMKQGSHEIPMLSSLGDKKGVLRLRTNLGALPAEYKSQIPFLNKDADLSKVFFNLTFSLKEKAFVISTEMDSEDEGSAKLVSEMSDYFRPIHGGQLQTPYEKPLALAVFNFDGETLCKKLGSSNPNYSMMLSGLNMFCNAGKMLEAIDGNVTVAIDDITDDSPRFCVTAQVKNKDFMRGAEHWGEGLAVLGMQCRQLEGDSYVLSTQGSKVCLGVLGDMLYFASDYDVAKSGRRFSSLSDGSSLESETEGKLSYLSVDIVRLKDSPLVKSYAQNESVKAMLGCLDRLNVSIGKDNNAEIELTTKQKLSDIIKTSLKK